ncbi:hypothetical protein GBAR_LOCUS13767, partial [Geodia barretti]
VCITRGVGLVPLTLRSQQFADFLSFTSLPRLYHGGDHRTVRRLAASLLPLVYEHPSLVLLVLSIVSYVLHILSGYPLQVGTDAIPRDESADGRQMLVFTEFLVGAGHSHACI